MNVVRNRVLPWVIVLTPFLVLYCFYDPLPDQITIARSFFDDDIVVAPKSLFTVFRVPLIEVVCAGAIELMRCRPSDTRPELRTRYDRFWTVLLYTVGLKSLLQAVEIVSNADWVFYPTLGVVIVGLAAAVVTGRKLLSGFRKVGGPFNPLRILALVFLLMAYLGLAIVPVYVYGQ